MLRAGDIRDLAAEHGLRPRKTFGQHFVVDANVLHKIVRLAELEPSDVVVEIGPGFGSLTLALLPHVAELIAVEVDRRLAALLPETVAACCPAYAARLTVVEADALDVVSLPTEPTALVANLPYNVAVPVLLRFLDRFPSIRRALVMVQREVAERLCATPGTEPYGAPSVKLRWYGTAKIVANVSREVFWPKPHVDSAVLRFDRGCVRTADAGPVFAVVDAAFRHRRKTLRSALAAWAGSREAAERVLRAAAVDPGARGEQLGLDEFVRIAELGPTLR
ncbi:MAG: 16S rRNA (adenine(1518)-N(6)/adenine(1519)-N(6))-dimethyltransferase RsmA [Acidothermus sp.]|nr:16S rRNA (adenine(1518)-N(6)/adenine(1519)-N(6))-dimethyltransferase RsmA [Acidothermus sp.]